MGPMRDSVVWSSIFKQFQARERRILILKKGMFGRRFKEKLRNKFTMNRENQEIHQVLLPNVCNEEVPIPSVKKCLRGQEEEIHEAPTRSHCK